MAGRMSVKMMAAVLAVFMMHQGYSSWGAAAQMTCLTVFNDIRPCSGAVNNNKGGGAPPPASCCNGILSVYSTILPALGSFATCTCIQNWLPTIVPAPQIGFASQVFVSLANQCNVTFGFDVSSHC